MQCSMELFSTAVNPPLFILVIKTKCKKSVVNQEYATSW